MTTVLRYMGCPKCGHLVELVLEGGQHQGTYYGHCEPCRETYELTVYSQEWDDDELADMVEGAEAVIGSLL